MKFVHAFAVATALLCTHAVAQDAQADERLRLARDYIAAAKPHAMFDDLPPLPADADADQRRRERALRDAPRDVMADSLARSLARRASVEQLREALTYAQSDAGRAAAECRARTLIVGVESQNCFESGKRGHAQFEQMVRAELGVPGEVGRMAEEGIDEAFSDSLRALTERDADTRRYFDEVCARKPDDGVCVSLMKRAPPESQPHPGD